MASTALANFNVAVDELANVSAARKAQIKTIGERLYVAGARETIAHLRKHMIAVRDSASFTAEQRQRAGVIVNLIDAMATYEDAWWIDITEKV